MKIQHVLKLATLTALLSIGFVNAQTSDSTSLPTTTTAVATKIPFINPQTFRHVWGNIGFYSYATCAANEVAVSGGGIVEDGSGNLCPWNRRLGFLHASHSTGNGWFANAFAPGYGDTCVQSYALCARVN